MENPHVQRSLAGYSPEGRKESDTTEWLSTWHLLKWLNTELPCDPTIPLLVIYPREVKIYAHTNTCTWIFIATLFISVKRWKHQMSIYWWILNSMCYIHAMGYNWAIKRSEVLLYTLKRLWCWGRLRAEGEGNDKEWDGWMASPTQWTWVWIGSGSWWWTGRPGVLQFMGSQRVGRNWATELSWTVIYCNMNEP